MITAYGGPPMLDPLAPVQQGDGIDFQGVNPNGFGVGTVVEMTRWHSDTISLVLARGLSYVTTDETALGARRIIQRIEIFPQTSEPARLAELRGLAASIEVQLRVSDELVYRCPLAGVLTLDSVLAQRLATLEKRLAAYEAELTNKLSTAGGEGEPLAVADGGDSFMRIHIPIDLDSGLRLVVSLVGLPSDSNSRAVPCSLTIALHGVAAEAPKPVGLTT